MERDQHLEEVSDKIRSGIPVSLTEALAAIDYQSARRAHAKHNVWWRRLLRYFTDTNPGATK